jgi:dihydrofolate synthase/folylpolyglutamate synthase
VSSFRERAQIDNVPISESEVVQVLPKIFATCKDNSIPGTFFELTTAMSLDHFHTKDVDMIVLETGLGGRLDSTNCVQSTISVITSIGLEHTRILGDTVELIAREKGGIMKPNKPCVVGPSCPIDTLREQADEIGAVFHTLSPDLLPGYEEDSFKSMDYDTQNSLLATAAIKLLRETAEYKSMSSFRNVDVTSEHVARGVSTRPPCRFESINTAKSDDGTGVDCILDVAHNPSAMIELFKKLGATHPDRAIKLVVGMSSDKDIGASIDTMLEHCKVSDVYLCEASHPRAALVEDMLTTRAVLKDSKGLTASDVYSQTRLALNDAAADNSLVIICGSVFIMSQARLALGIDEARDSDYIAEEAGANLRKDMQEHFGDRVLSESEDEDYVK